MTVQLPSDTQSTPGRFTIPTMVKIILLLVIVIPIVALFLVASLTLIAVVIAIALILWGVKRILRGLAGAVVRPADGRENVRVIERR
ncbi:MAG: hypothetical protein EXS15_06005 [Phycisphaerales bacterium]|nr:hypothetical protein [Phycisphaerales bacterium]